MNRKELKIVTVFPDYPYFTWQVHLWLENLRSLGLSDKVIALVFVLANRKPNKEGFQQIADLYPEAEFVWYSDVNNEISKHVSSTYISVLRPWTAWKYWKDHPEMKDKAVFYCDSDILLTKNFNIDKFLDDDIIYCSDTNSYINATYFDSKINQVIPEKLEEYKKIDVLEETSRLVGINRKICEDNNKDSGGAQYILKNIDANYWKSVMYDCLSIIRHLRSVNRIFFKSESEGFQSWTADMWAVLWNLWKRGQETKVVDELDFAWAHDPITKLDKVGIYHNAGVTKEFTGTMPVFFKGKYHRGSDPTKDPHLDVVLANEETKKRCIWYYASKLDELRKKYNLNY